MVVSLLAMIVSLYFQDFYLTPDWVLLGSKVHSRIQQLVVFQRVVVFARPDDKLRIVVASQDMMVDHAEGANFARRTLGTSNFTQGGFGWVGNH
jgi:hypothetical protein